MAGRTGSTPLPPLVLVVVSASGVVKGGLLLPDLRVSGGGSHLLSGPFPAVVCPSIGRPGGTGAEPWVVEVLRVGYCLPFLSAPPLSNVPIPMPSYSPTSIMGAALEEVPLGLMASGHRPLPSPSLCGRVSLPHGDHSVCAPVGASGGLDGLHRSEGSVHCLPIQSAVLWPLHGSAGLHQGHGSCFSYTPFYGVPYEPVSQRLASPVCLSGVPPQGSSDCPPTLSRVGDCDQTPRNPTWFHRRWFSIWGLSSTTPLSGLLRRRSASLGCSQQPQSFSPAPRLPRAYGSRYLAYFLRWLT